MSSTNWRSVASSAASGMLLTSPISMQLRLRNSTAAASAGFVSRRSGISLCAPDLFGGDERRRAVRLHGGERLIEIGQNVVDVLDADADADRLRPDARLLLLFGRHLPVRGRGRMARKRLGVAHIDQPLDQLERIVKFLARFETAGDAEREERAGMAAEILARQRVIGVVGKAGVVDPRHARVAAQKFGGAARVFDVTLDAQGD